jgi:hypothetical protein
MLREPLLPRGGVLAEVLPGETDEVVVARLADLRVVRRHRRDQQPRCLTARLGVVRAPAARSGALLLTVEALERNSTMPSNPSRKRGVTWRNRLSTLAVFEFTARS